MPMLPSPRSAGATAGAPAVALLTKVHFWRTGAGHRTRILGLARALSEGMHLSVVWPLALSDEDRAALAQALPGARVHALNLPPQGSADEARATLAHFFAARAHTACIFEYLDLAWLRPAVPPGVLSLVDTHDVVSERDAALQAAGVELGRQVLSSAQERARLALFDKVLAISEADAQVFSRWLGAQRVLLVPHAAELHHCPQRPALRRLLFVGSQYAPNTQGLRWFLQDVWPRLAGLGLTLDVVGGAGPAMGLQAGDGVQVHGQIQDLHAAYALADICINPVHMGSGLKIKTVEALAHGRPLVTTSHGARGLERHGGVAFCVADEAQSFADAIMRLVLQPEQAASVALAGQALAAKTFGPSACYGPLLQLLQGRRAAEGVN